MSADEEDHWAVLKGIARGHAGASSGERAAWEILQNLTQGRALDFGDCFVRLDGRGKRAVLMLMIAIATGKVGLADLR